jgi:endo-1,4-beta-D-glucanase Y
MTAIRLAPALAVAIAAAFVVPSMSSAAGGNAGDDAILHASWRGFVSAYIAPDGAVRRPEHDDDTVSEGQAYAMLRAAWMNDRPVFDRVWQWTREHLIKAGDGNDGLLAWHWERSGGSGHVTDWNFASDADADYAFALILASRRWKPGDGGRAADGYLQEARRILALLLNRATAPDREGIVMWLPGSWADERAEHRGLVLNPSYFAPAWFRIFNEVTGDARWLQLADSSYVVLRAVCGRSSRSLRVVPDWIRWQSASEWTLRDDRDPVSSWDAVRVPWRVGTDRLWFHTQAARLFLDGCLEPLVRTQRSGLAVELTASGEIVGGRDHPLANAMYWFAVSAAAGRDRLIDRVRQHAVWAAGPSLSFGDGRHYYVDSLAYLPFLARTGRYAAR